MKSAFRLLRLGGALVVALVATGVSHAQDDIVPIRDNPDLLQQYRWMYVADRIPPPLSYLDSPHPFKAIALDVQGAFLSSDDLDELREFAVRAMRSRLQELNAADQVMVLGEPQSQWSGSQPPQGLSYCDVFHVAFQLASAPRPSATELVVAMTMLAYQPAENEAEPSEQRCMQLESRPSWVLHNGPRFFVLYPDQREAMLAQAREQILLVIDRVLIWDAIIRSNETARRSFYKVVFGRE